MRTAVLCVHGIQGSPDQFDFIIRALPDDAHVENVLLPGHGGSARDFGKGTRVKWQEFINERLAELRRDHDRVIYIGHSMGCLLGIHAQLEMQSIDSMVLLACPLKIRFTWRYIRNNLLAASRRPSDDPFVLAARRLHSVTAKHMWEYLFCIRPYFHLFSLMASANRRLHKLSIPFLAVHSERDEIVSRKSMDKLAQLSCGEIYLARGCGHMHYLPDEQAGITSRILEHIQKASAG